MSLIPTIYSSTDAGAPVLTGQAGSMLTLLRALLVNGYGTAPNAKAGLGWTEEFAGTNKAAFRNNPTSGTGYRLRIDDTQTRATRVRAYATMTNVDTGTGITPTTAQRSNGSLWPKSGTTDATARLWWAIGNERCFYLFVAVTPDYPTLSDASIYFAGDINSLKASDAHRFAVSTMGLNSYDGSIFTETSRLMTEYHLLSETPTAATANLFLARAGIGTGGAVPALNINDRGGSYGAGTGPFPYPYPYSSGMLWEKSIVTDGSNQPRGFMPGVITPLHARPFADLQVLENVTGMPAGARFIAKNFVGVAPINNNTHNCQVLFDLGAWS